MMRIINYDVMRCREPMDYNVVVKDYAYASIAGYLACAIGVAVAVAFWEESYVVAFLAFIPCAYCAALACRFYWDGCEDYLAYMPMEDPPKPRLALELYGLMASMPLALINALVNLGTWQAWLSLAWIGMGFVTLGRLVPIAVKWNSRSRRHGHIARYRLDCMRMRI